MQFSQFSLTQKTKKERKKNQCNDNKLLSYFRLVTDIDLDDASTPSPSKSDASEPDDIGVHIISTSRLPQACNNVTITNISSNSSVAEDDELGDGLRTGPSSILSIQPIAEDSGPSSIQNDGNLQSTSSHQLARTGSLSWIPSQERRRRKLPEIPKNKKCEKLMPGCCQF